MCATNNDLTFDLIKEYFQDTADFKVPKLYIDIPSKPKLHVIPIYANKDRKIGHMAFLRYESNKTINEDLGKVENWDVFATDLLTGCLFCAYRTEGEIMVLHSNLCPSQETGLKQDRFKIAVQNNKVTIIKDPFRKYDKYEELIVSVPLEDILYCCYPVTTTIIKGDVPRDRFIEYEINTTLRDGYCSVFATKGPVFHAIVKTPKEETGKLYTTPKKSECILL